MILIINCGSIKTKHFSEILNELKYNSKEVLLQDFKKTITQDISSIIISGAPILLTQEGTEKYLDLLSGVFSLNLPILGVCFGHQMLGVFHEAKVMVCHEDRDWQKIHVTTPSDLWNEKVKVVEMMEDHTECITLPSGFRLIASSQICEVEAMQHITLPWYGVQFHPEVSGKQGVELLKKFTEVVERYKRK